MFCNHYKSRIIGIVYVPGPQNERDNEGPPEKESQYPAEDPDEDALQHMAFDELAQARNEERD